LRRCNKLERAAFFLTGSLKNERRMPAGLFDVRRTADMLFDYGAVAAI